MATVDRAKHHGIQGFERTVALKRLLPVFAKRPDIVRMFVREASLASKLQHPNIVQVYELGEVNGTYFISMEYVDGWTLSDVIRRAQRLPGSTVPLEISTTLLAQLFDALDYAHNVLDDHGKPLNLVHRDISPANLLVTRTGHLKVIDFGIAQRGIDSDEEGGLKGKFGYTAPELLVGRAPSPQTDLFAAGVVAFELLAGESLFGGQTDLETLERILYTTPVPPSEKNPRCFPALDQVVSLALNKDPELRAGTAGQLRDELERIRSLADLQITSTEIARWLREAFESKRAPTEPQKARRFPRGTLGLEWEDEDAFTPLEHQPVGYYADLEVTTATGATAEAVEAVAEITSGGDSRSRRERIAKMGLVAIAILSVATVILLGLRGLSTERETTAAVPSPPAKARVQLAVEPADAVIRIVGQPPLGQGMVELDQGIYSISIEREGYQSWLSTIEFAAGQRHTVAVRLVALAARESPPRVALTPEKRGLRVTVDGVERAEVTPADIELTVGQHRLALIDDDDEELWATQIDARTDQRYEFSPTIEHREPERVTSSESARTERGSSQGKEHSPAKAAAVAEPLVEQTLDPEPQPTLFGSFGSLLPDQLTTVPSPVAPVKKAPNNKPRIVRATDVSRISGTFPKLRRRQLEGISGSRAGAVLVCISTAGRVTSAKSLGQGLPKDVVQRLTSSARNFRYRPYNEDGAAVPACFAIPFRLGEVTR